MEKKDTIKKSMVDDCSLLTARDLLVEALEDVQNMQEMIMVLQLGFDGLTCKERISEISSLYIINQHLKMLEETKLAVISDILEGYAKGK